jgi:hypothetical protein
MCLFIHSCDLNQLSCGEVSIRSKALACDRRLDAR